MALFGTLSDALKKEAASFQAPTHLEVAPSPKIGSTAPPLKTLAFPTPDGRPVIITFLRHCGSPFAEKTFKLLTKISSRHPSIRYIAVSHSSQAATDEWIPKVGGEWNVEVVVDESREQYAQWGLGLASTWQVANPYGLYTAYRLGKDEGIWNRPTESGSRWQLSGNFAVDATGAIKWVDLNSVPDFEKALEALGELEPTKADAPR